MAFSCTTVNEPKYFSVTWRRLYDRYWLFRIPLRNKKENTLRGDNFYLSDRPSVSDQVSASKPFSAFLWTWL